MSSSPGFRCRSLFGCYDWVTAKQQKLVSHGSGGWEVHDRGSGGLGGW